MPGQAAEGVRRADAEDGVEAASLVVRRLGLLERHPLDEAPPLRPLPRLLDGRDRRVDADAGGLRGGLQRGEQPLAEPAAEVEHAFDRAQPGEQALQVGVGDGGGDGVPPVSDGAGEGSVHDRHPLGRCPIAATRPITVLVMSAGRSPDVRPQEAMRLMAATAGVIAVLAGTVGASRGDGQLLAVGVAFAALTVYLYARWRDAVGRGNPALLGAAVVVCAAACIGLAVTGYWWFALCLSVPTVFGVLRWTRRDRTPG